MPFLIGALVAYALGWLVLAAVGGRPAVPETAEGRSAAPELTTRTPLSEAA